MYRKVTHVHHCATRQILHNITRICHKYKTYIYYQLWAFNIKILLFKICNHIQNQYWSLSQNIGCGQSFLSLRYVLIVNRCKLFRGIPNRRWMFRQSVFCLCETWTRYRLYEMSKLNWVNRKLILHYQWNAAETSMQYDKIGSVFIKT